MGNHPLSAIKFIEKHQFIPAGCTALCAVSGGMDSMCLLHLLHTLAPRLGFALRAAHFNHGLRGEEAERDEAFVQKVCQRWGIPLTVGRGDTRPFARREGLTIEEGARILRYAFLEETAQTQGCDRIATAHTADDNAETLLLHLLRGTGLQGLAGIPPKRGRIVRPLLTTTRAGVEEYCAAHGVPHVEDSTNADEAYTRNFIRRQVMPLLARKNPRVVEDLSAAAGRLRADSEYLSAQAERIAAQAVPLDGGLTIPAAAIGEAPGPLAVRAVRALLGELRGGDQDCSAAHLEAVVRVCQKSAPSAQVCLPGGLTARRVYGELRISAAREESAPVPPVPLALEGRTDRGGWSVFCRRTVCPEKNFKNPDTFFLSCDKIIGTLTLRSRQEGDSIQLPGRRTRTLKKLMIDRKVPRMERALLPVLADEAGVAAAAAFGPDASRLAKPGEDAFGIVFVKT